MTSASRCVEGDTSVWNLLMSFHLSDFDGGFLLQRLNFLYAPGFLQAGDIQVRDLWFKAGLSGYYFSAEINIPTPI